MINSRRATIRSLLIAVCFSLMCSLNCHAQYKEYHGDGIDDYLRFVPAVAVYGLKAAGVESSSSWKRLAVNSAMAYAITCGVTWGLKASIHDMRPDGTDNHGFPSGHTSFAFAGATVLHKEFYHKSLLISIAGYALATGVAVDRICRNRHEWDDVLAGALIGIAGTELGYWLGDKITGEHSRYALGVAPNGLSLAINLP